MLLVYVKWDEPLWDSLYSTTQQSSKKSFNLKKPRKNKKMVMIGRNILLVNHDLLKAQDPGKKLCFFHWPSLSIVEVQKKEFHQQGNPIEFMP